MQIEIIIPKWKIVHDVAALNVVVVFAFAFVQILEKLRDVRIIGDREATLKRYSWENVIKHYVRVVCVWEITVLCWKTFVSFE